LIIKAKEILKEKGFNEDQIYEDFTFMNHKIDVVGWRKERKIAVDLGHCSQNALKELQQFFDEVICFTGQKPSAASKKELPRSSRKIPLSRHPGLKLLLIKNKDTLIEIPLSTEDWSRERLDDELTSLEIRFDQFSKIFDALSHETRLRMMKHILEAEDQTTSFAEFMRDLDLNPKLVWENTRKLHDGGLVEKVEKGRYRCSEFGRMEFMMNLAIRRLMEALEGLES